MDINLLSRGGIRNTWTTFLNRNQAGTEFDYDESLS